MEGHLKLCVSMLVFAPGEGKKFKVLLWVVEITLSSVDVGVHNHSVFLLVYLILIEVLTYFG